MTSSCSSTWKIGPQGDSGVYLRGRRKFKSGTSAEPRYAPMGADKGSGGLWNNSPGAPGNYPLVRADNPVGQWNTFHIIQVGARTTIYLNFKLVVDNAILENYWRRSLPIPARGPVQLQTHDHEIHWRNISVREIPSEEANQILAKPASDGFKPVFNGQNLANWAGPIENYEVKDGVLRCKPNEGGTIYYNQELTDFMARVEFKLPPGGNNGLAIRYPGKGDTAYDGMCELQILDDGDSKYGSLDPRQAHGSAYGMVAAARGYLRPVGQWNFQEVTVKGSKIKVELNGIGHPRHRFKQGQGIHGRLGPPRQGPNLRLLRLRRPQRSSRIPERVDQGPGLAATLPARTCSGHTTSRFARGSPQAASRSPAICATGSSPFCFRYL